MRIEEPILPDRFLYCNCGGLVAITIFPVKKATGYSHGIHMYCKDCKKEWIMYDAKQETETCEIVKKWIDERSVKGAEKYDQNR